MTKLSDQSLHYIYLFVAIIFITTNNAVALKKLGNHKPPSGGATVLGGKFPPPSVFFHHFVNPGKPLLMKNVLNTTRYGAFEDWTDKYLRSRYGLEDVGVELGRKEDRNARVRQMRLLQYLNLYASKDVYLVHNLPKVMQDDIQVPFTLQCGGYQDHLHEAVMWLSGGNTKSVLHYDPFDNIICQLDGDKQFVLIDKIHKHLVEAEGFMQSGSYSLVDVDAVDPHQFPGIMAAPWKQVNVTKGDCLYIPYKWYHQVSSPPGRNLAVNLWFSHLWWFNTSDCDGVDVGTPLKPLGDYKLASANQQLRTHFLAPFVGLEVVSLVDFLKNCICDDKKDAQKMWSMINKDGDSNLSWPEMYAFNMDDLVTRFPHCFHADAKVNELDSNGELLGTNAELDKNMEGDGLDNKRENLNEKSKMGTNTKDEKVENENLSDKVKTDMEIDQKEGSSKEKVPDADSIKPSSHGQTENIKQASHEQPNNIKPSSQEQPDNVKPSSHKQPDNIKPSSHKQPDNIKISQEQPDSIPDGGEGDVRVDDEKESDEHANVKKEHSKHDEF